MLLAADTWGISGSVFANCYLLAWVAVLAAHVLVVNRGPKDLPRVELTPDELGYLAAGPVRAVQAATAQAVASGRTPSFGSGRTDWRTMAPATPLQAACAAWINGARVTPLLRDKDVRLALRQIESRLAERGVWFSSSTRAVLRALRWMMVGLTVLGLARLVAGIAGDKPVGYLIAMLILGPVVGLIVTRSPALSLPPAVEKLRGNGRKVRKPNAITPLGTAAATTVALSGAGALAAIDGGLATAMGKAGITSAAGTGGGSGGGYSCSGGTGSGCGGGGGCGGGCGG